MKHFVILLIFVAVLMSGVDVLAQDNTGRPVRLAVSGISHGHSSWLFGSKKTADVEITGIYEPDTILAATYQKRFNLPGNLFYTDLEKMLDTLRPEAVAAFGSIRAHLATVEACAPRGIHVMVEKPLSFKKADAQRMVSLANKHKILLLTNYETSWYPTVQKTYQLVHDDKAIGKITKVLVNDGHSGLKNSETNKYFFEWLTDPVENGGGALTDFGCYGANLMTWLMKGEKPSSVTAVIHHLQPDVYTKVDDEATIILNYPTAQCIIQASWNWPFSRKDMEVYGDAGYVIAENANDLRIRTQNNSPEQRMEIGASETGVYENPFTYFAHAIRGVIDLPPYGLYSPENNLTVALILDAATQSARSGKTVYLK